MKRSSNKFLHRVRIHGGEFDASARAMHRDGMTSSFQAAVETVSIATIERKQMSTKTTFKRVALVTVAALGFGLLATVPSQATVSAGVLSSTATAASQLTGETSTAGAGNVSMSFLNTIVGDTVSVTAYLISAPAGNIATPVLQLSETSSAVVENDAQVAYGATSLLGYENTTQVAYLAGTTAPANVSAKWNVYMGAPSKVGTYVVKIVPAIVSGGGLALDTTGVTVTITVATNPASDTVATSATSIITKWVDTATIAAATADSANISVSKSAGSATTNQVATIRVSLKNAAGIATVGESYTALVKSGPGLLGQQAITTAVPSAIPTGRTVSVVAGNDVLVFADGASGVSTIEIQSALGVVLATETLTFFGTATTITATAAKTVVGVNGSGEGAILVNLKDAAGTTVTTATTFYVTSDATTKISGAYTSTNNTSVAYSTTNGTYGAGFLVKVAGVAAGSANVTVGTKASATATTGLNATPVAIRVGSTTPASVEVTLDKSSYIPGEKATITIVLKDSTGLTLADEDYTSIFATGGIVADYTLGSGSDTTTATSVLDFASGEKTYSVYMPVSETDVSFEWTTADVAAAATTGLALANRDVDGKITVSVKSSSGAAATDAANEATDAANAATDAANAAAEAADAATAAAQDAADAVAALSTQVATLISALKAQITSLTNLVIKIQKKVKA